MKTIMKTIIEKMQFYIPFFEKIDCRIKIKILTKEEYLDLLNGTNFLDYLDEDQEERFFKDVENCKFFYLFENYLNSTETCNGLGNTTYIHFGKNKSLVCSETKLK